MTTVACPECVAQSLDSQVQRHAGPMVTMMEWAPHIDDAGVEHHHNPNVHTETWTCSQGHEFQCTWYAPCPACGPAEPEKRLRRKRPTKATVKFNALEHREQPCPVCGVMATGKSTYHTDMAGASYVDKAGLWHDHDPNHYSTQFVCPAGHKFTYGSYLPCPACGRRHYDETSVRIDP
jgi:hypothetical protein